MLGKVAEHFKRRSIVALISDLYENPDDLLEALKPYRFLGNDLVVFHVLDPAEIDFPVHARRRGSRISRAARKCPVVPESFADQYRKMMQEHIDALTTQVLGGAHRLRAAQHVASRSTTRCSRISATASG